MRILCAAIRYKEKVFIGKCHADIGRHMVESGACPRPFPGGDDQGFVTEDGMYVRRAPALRIAIDAGQVKEGDTYNEHHLFSEDIVKCEETFRTIDGRETQCFLAKGHAYMHNGSVDGYNVKW